MVHIVPLSKHLKLKVPPYRLPSDYEHSEYTVILFMQALVRHLQKEDFSERQKPGNNILDPRASAKIINMHTM